MMGRGFAAQVEDCLQRLDRGEDLPDVLADYPQESERLKPILLVAMASRTFTVPVPHQTAQRLGRNQMLAEMNRLEIKGAFRNKEIVPLTSRISGSLARVLRQGGYNKLAYSYRLAMVALVLVLTGGFLTLNASASSQPGDFLYTLKISLQRAGLVWTLEAEDNPPLSAISDQGPDFQVPVGPKKAGRYIEVFNNLERGSQTENGPNPNPPSPGTPQQPPPGEANQLAETRPELSQELQEIEKEEREAEKDLKEEQKEAERDLKQEEKQADREEKKAERDLEEEEREAQKEEREAEKDRREEEREAEKEQWEAEKDLKEEEKQSGQNDRNEVPVRKEKDTKAEKIDKPGNQGKAKNKAE